MGVIVDQFLESSIMEENLATRWVFLWLCQLSDHRGRVDVTRNALARKIGVNRKQLDIALERLMHPDPESRSHDHEGRRILPLDDQRTWGWQVVNARAYQIRAQRRRRRAQDREYQREKRRFNRSDKKRPTDADACRRLPTDADARRPSPPSALPPLRGGVDKSTPPCRLTPAQQDLKSISDVFERFGATPLKGKQHGAWAVRLKQYRDFVQRGLAFAAPPTTAPKASDEDFARTEGLTLLLSDLEEIGRAGHIRQRGKSYVLKIIIGLIDEDRCGEFRAPVAKNDPTASDVSDATLRRAALLDEDGD